jgi:nucleoside triphosphate pyrophosphatase
VSDVRLVLASESPARLATLRGAGIEPVVEVSGVDESLVREATPAGLALTLARLKGQRVASRTAAESGGPRVLVLGCDSVLELDGEGYGKPGSAEVATRRLALLRGRTAVLHTGHHLTDLHSGAQSGAVASTAVTFGSFSDAEIAAYVATGEPLAVAGAFTIDGLGGAFVDRVDGDPHTVVGLSLPLLRRMVGELGIEWHRLWNRPRPPQDPPLRRS